MAVKDFTGVKIRILRYFDLLNNVSFITGINRHIKFTRNVPYVVCFLLVYIDCSGLYYEKLGCFSKGFSLSKQSQEKDISDHVLAIAKDFDFSILGPVATIGCIACR